jgi:hypothetical protein
MCYGIGDGADMVIREKIFSTITDVFSAYSWEGARIVAGSGSD